MDASGQLAELPSTVRDLVLGHWPDTEPEPMRRNGDSYMLAHQNLNTSADEYEARASRTGQTIDGATANGMAERDRAVAQSMRDKAAACESMGQQCYDVADSTVQIQHLLIVTGIVLAAQLAYDMLLFFQGGGMKALADRLAAEEAMRAAVARFTTEVAQHAAAGTARRAALHGAIHAAKIGALNGAITSAAAQAWDMSDGVRQKFDVASFLELIAGGTVGGLAGAEVGRRVAPKILGRVGRGATSDLGRLAAHMGGTVLIGSAGGLAGGAAGALPSALIHYKDIHSLGDLFEMVRASAVTGFAGGFLGAATNSLRVHQAGRAAYRADSAARAADGAAKAGDGAAKIGDEASPGSDGVSPIGARQREFGARVEELLRSEQPPHVHEIERSDFGQSARVVERLTFHDGTEVIHKEVSEPRHAQAEYLSSLVGDAVGARVPAVHVIGDHVYMELVPGLSAADAYPGRTGHEVLVGTADGVRLGVLDSLIRMPDRNTGNWMVDPSAGLWGIDHSRAFETADNSPFSIGPFAEHFQEYGPGDQVQWKSHHDLTRAEVQEIRRNVEELGPAFAAAGRPDWHNAMMQRADALEQRAVDVAGPRRPTVSPPPGEAPTRTPEPSGRRPGTGERGVSTTPRADRPASIDESAQQRRPGTPPNRTGDEVDADPAGPPIPRADDEVGAASPRERTEVTREEQPPPAEPMQRDKSAEDGPPTRPQPRAEPNERRSGDDLRPAVHSPGQTMHFKHPDGYVDVVLTGPNGERLPLRLMPGQEYILGRGTGTLLEHMATDVVSRSHGIIKVDDQGHVFLRDNGSLNGTFVDGKQLVGQQWIRVYDGQDLLLGRGFDLGLTFQRQLAEVRLFGDNGPVLRLHRGQTIDAGRAMMHPDTPGRDTVSRNHVTVGMDENGRVWLRDNNSSNGTRVNGEALSEGEQRTLRPGDAVRLGAYRGEAQFVAPDGPLPANPVRVLIGTGPGAVPVRLEPGHTAVIGTEEGSPFASQLRAAAGVDPRHATLGLDHDGRLWIRDHDGSAGVWVNGDRVAPGQKVTLAEGDNVRLGPDFVGMARFGADEPMPPAGLHFPPDLHRRPIRLEPGQEEVVNVSELNGHAMMFRNGKPVGGHEVTVGRDLDGRLWVRDPVQEGWVSTKVNDETIPSNEKRYLDADDKVSFENVSTRVQLGAETPLQVRLSDEAHVPPVSLRRGEEIKLGTGPDSPMSQHMSGSSVSPHHATIYRDDFGNLWLRDEHSAQGTWVNGRKVDPDAAPVRLEPGDTIRMGDWVGSAQYGGDGFREPTPRPAPVKLNSRQGEVTLDLVRGGEPILLGRDQTQLPPGVPRPETISSRHASVGVHPSGRVWIRDEGSTNGTFVNGTKIKPGTMVTLRPGDEVSLASGAYEFTVGFTPAEGGPFINMVDSTPQSRQVLAHLAQVPEHVFQRVSDHMNAMPDGGIVVGNRPVTQLPGMESVLLAHPDGPNDKVKWKNVVGLYSQGPRRFYVDSRNADDGYPGHVVWHEFGHAADAAYGVGGRGLSEGHEWKNLHASMLQAIGQHPEWWPYRNTPDEGFADAFAAWVAGPATVRKFACGNEHFARQLEQYFERNFK